MERLQTVQEMNERTLRQVRATWEVVKASTGGSRTYSGNLGLNGGEGEKK